MSSWVPQLCGPQERCAHAPEEGGSPRSAAVSPGLVLGLVGPGAEGQGWEEPVGDMIPFPEQVLALSGPSFPLSVERGWINGL